LPDRSNGRHDPGATRDHLHGSESSNE
jgi:hypothetical protein